MKVILVLLLIAAVIGGVYLTFFRKSGGETGLPEKNQFFGLKNYNTSMTISSPDFNNNGDIPSKFTCDDTGVSPELVIGGTPADAKSLVLIMDDPDSPGGNFVHWLVWNIDPRTTDIGQGLVPGGAIQGKNSFEENRYGGPCPHSGIHHYHFKIYALDVTLDLPDEADKALLEKTMISHILAKAELTGLYKRK